MDSSIRQQLDELNEEQMTDEKKKQRLTHIQLTTHPGQLNVEPIPIKWGDKDPSKRGPLIASFSSPKHRNCIGAHSGSYSVYKALAVAAGALDPQHRPDLTNTAPAIDFGPFDGWGDPKKIVSMDPFGHDPARFYKSFMDEGYDIRPTIAVTKAHINMPEFKQSIRDGRLKPDGKVLTKNGDVIVTKAAVEPVWWLPGIAERFHCDEGELRRCIFEHTGGMFPELITRPDLEAFLPPIGGLTAYFIGDFEGISNPNVELSCRVHDECNGSDVFGSDICTCRPYLVHGIEVCIETAQRGGAGLIVYNRKEGRALGEVTKFLVYNARKRQEGGDTAAKYFERTECVAGVQDMRFQELMPDILHWLGVKKIDNFVSMSDMKHDSITNSGIKITNRVEIPADLIPDDAKVEMDAKKAAGYFTPGEVPDASTLNTPKGRGLDE
jgi:GTP cyclohydrolase II